MKHSSFLILIILLGFSSISFAQPGKLSGKVIDASTRETIPSATLILEQNGRLIKSCLTDIDGRYSFTSVPADAFTLKVSFVGFKEENIDSIFVRPGESKILDIQLSAIAQQIDGVVVTAYGISKTKRILGSSTVATTSVNTKSTPAMADFQTGRNATAFPEAGTLTASELNDFSKWDLWQDIRKNDLKYFQKQWKISPTSRYAVQVVNSDNRPVVDAEITLNDGKGKPLWKARTDNTGKAELWSGMFNNEKARKLKLVAQYGGKSYTFEKPNLFNKGMNVMKIPSSCEVPDAVDIAFVVDATGSMDDEIDFLQSELVDIIKKAKSDFPGVSLNLGSTFYRCFGNSYATRSSSLSPDIDKTINFIKAQRAGEGGDEIVEEGFRVAIDSIGWRSSARARLLFFVLDEQPLINSAVIEKMQLYIQKAAEKGIRVIPVIASAESPENAQSLEYLMRSVVLATNGRYVFLTDHSKIGDAHAKPTTDQYDVEFLNKLLQRIIYQFCFVPSCDDKLTSKDLPDTTFVGSRNIIAHEIIDTLRTVKVKEQKILVVDFTSNPINDSTKTVDAGNAAFSESDARNTESKRITPEVGIKFFPNPTKGIVNIDIIGNIDELFLTDITGKLLARYKTGSQTVLVIDLSRYSRGIYFLKFNDGSQFFNGKVILN